MCEWDHSAACVAYHTAATKHKFQSVNSSEVADCVLCVFGLMWEKFKTNGSMKSAYACMNALMYILVTLRRCLCMYSMCVFLPDDGRDAYYCSDSGGFPFWEHPSSHLFFSSLTSMPPDSQWVKGFSCSMPPESCCHPCFIIVFIVRWGSVQAGENTSVEKVNKLPD